MTKKERNLLDKAALAAFAALMAKDSAALIERRATRAWEAADTFIKARRADMRKRFLAKMVKGTVNRRNE